MNLFKNSTRGLALVSFFCLGFAAETYAQRPYTVKRKITHNITWGFNELRLNRFMDISNPMGFTNRYTDGTRTRLASQGLQNVLNVIWDQGIRDLRMLKINSFDAGWGYAWEDFMNRDLDKSPATDPNPFSLNCQKTQKYELGNPNPIGFDLSCSINPISGFVTPKFYSEQIPTFIANTLMHGKLADFNVLLCLSELPYDLRHYAFRKWELNHFKQDNLSPIYEELLDPISDQVNLDIKMINLNGNKLGPGGINDFSNPYITYDQINSAGGTELVDFYEHTKKDNHSLLTKFNHLYPEYLNDPVLGSDYQYSNDMYYQYVRDICEELKNSGRLSTVSFEIGNEFDVPYEFIGTPMEFVTLANGTNDILSEYGADQIAGGHLGVHIGGWTQRIMTNLMTPTARLRYHNYTVRRYYTLYNQLPDLPISFHAYQSPNVDKVGDDYAIGSDGYAFELYNPWLHGVAPNILYKRPDYFRILVGIPSSQGGAPDLEGIPYLISYSDIHTGYKMNESAITEWNVFSNVENKDDYDYQNSPYFVYEMAKFLMYASENRVPKVYVHQLIDGARLDNCIERDKDDNCIAIDESIEQGQGGFFYSYGGGMFHYDGTPKESWKHFKMVHDIIKDGYVITKMEGPQGETFVDIMSQDQADNVGYTYFLRVVLQGDHTLSGSERILGEGFKRSQDISNKTKIQERGWSEMFTFSGGLLNGGSDNQSGNTAPEVVISPNPAGCGPLQIALKKFTGPEPIENLRVQILLAITGEIVMNRIVEKGKREVSVDACEFNPGDHIVIFKDGDRILASEKMIINR
ncbi:MAG: hypothetical protein EP338_08390 [Bacteroidetes bacterium]|nr:MAG: hypothetical protein EP338_08390 [Bacteroidota bacterium]